MAWEENIANLASHHYLKLMIKYAPFLIWPIFILMMSMNATKPGQMYTKVTILHLTTQNLKHKCIKTHCLTISSMRMISRLQ